MNPRACIAGVTIVFVAWITFRAPWGVPGSSPRGDHDVASANAIRATNAVASVGARMDSRTHPAAHTQNAAGAAGESAARGETIEDLVRQLTFEDVSTVESVLPEIASLLQRGDPRAAADFIAGLPAGVVQRDLLGRHIAAWSRAHFEDVLAWARGLPAGEVRSQAVLQLSRRWWERDRPAALAYALEVGATTPQLAAALASDWAEGDPRGASAWAMEIADDGLRARVVGGVAAVWARNEPRAAAGFALELPPGEAQTQAVISATSGWAAQDPAAAAAWAERFPPGHLQAAVFLQVAHAWGRRYAAGAGAWLARLPESAARDAALGAFVQEIAASHPAIAFTFAESITGPALREQLLERVARHLLRSAPDGTARALAESSLSGAALARLFPSVRPSPAVDSMPSP